MEDGYEIGNLETTNVDHQLTVLYK